MERPVVNSEHRHMEQALSNIGAKVADAADELRQAKETIAYLETILISAQREMEALYVCLESDETEKEG